MPLSLSPSVTDLIGDKIAMKALFEFSPSLSDQALVVGLVSIESALEADSQEIAAHARRLLSSCFTARGPFVSHSPSARRLQVDALRSVLEDGHNAIAIRDRLHALRQSIIDEIDTQLLPEFHKRQPAPPSSMPSSPPIAVQSLDDVIQDPDNLAFFARFALQDDAGRRAMSAYAYGGDDGAVDALSKSCWERFVRSDLYAAMVVAGRGSRSTFRALRTQPMLQDLITTVTDRGPEPLVEIGSFVSAIECRWTADSSRAELVGCFPSDDDLAAAIPTFCFPIGTEPIGTDQDADLRAFTFVLTRANGSRRYACCRQIRTDDGLGALCAISTRPDYESLKALVDRADLSDMRQALMDGGESSSDDHDRRPQLNVSALFQLLHPLRIMALLEAILLEQKVVLVSGQLSLLTMVGETIRWLLRPFPISAVYIPILPSALIDALQCPTSFLIGLHRSTLEAALETVTTDRLCVADLDNDRLWAAGAKAPPPSALPSSVRAPILHALRRVCFGRLVDLDHRIVHREVTIEAWRISFQKALQDLLLFELGRFTLLVPNLDADDPNRVVVVFDAGAFLATKPRSWQIFLQALFGTAGFLSFLSQVALDAARTSPRS